jgi:hypothetical protein
MELLREIQQFLQDEADSQRFAWEGREFLDPNDIKLREWWRGFGALPDAEEGKTEGVKMHGFRDSIPLEHQAEWDAYLKKNPGALAGKAQGDAFNLETSNVTCNIDAENGDLHQQGGTGYIDIRKEDFPLLIAKLQAAVAHVPQQTPTTRTPSGGPGVHPAPPTSFSNPPNYSNRPYQGPGHGPHGRYMNSAPVEPAGEAKLYDPAPYNRQAQRNEEALEFALKQERKYNTTVNNWKKTDPANG